MTKTVYVLNGPNLNLLGVREPATYGNETLGDIEAMLKKKADAAKINLVFKQTNREGELVDWVQEAGLAKAGILLNAGAYTHTSIAIHDAIRASNALVIELHLSNVFARETFRHHSYISPVAKGVICGFGAASYELAFDAILPHLV